MKPPMSPMRPPVTIEGPRMLGLIPRKCIEDKEQDQTLKREKKRERTEKERQTGEVADGNGNSSDG